MSIEASDTCPLGNLSKYFIHVPSPGSSKYSARSTKPLVSPSRVLLTRRTMLITSCHGRFILHGWLRTEKKKVDVPSEKKSFTKFSPLDFRPVIAPVNIVKYCHLLGRNIHILISSFPVQNIFQCTRSTKFTCWLFSKTIRIISLQFTSSIQKIYRCAFTQALKKR